MKSMMFVCAVLFVVGAASVAGSDRTPQPTTEVLASPEPFCGIYRTPETCFAARGCYWDPSLARCLRTWE